MALIFEKDIEILRTIERETKNGKTFNVYEFLDDDYNKLYASTRIEDNFPKIMDEEVRRCKLAYSVSRNRETGRVYHNWNILEMGE